MSTLAQPGTSQTGTVDAQRVEDALSSIAPRWTTWIVQALSQQPGPMRVRDVATRLPFVSEQLVSKRLTLMHADGLVTRPDSALRGAPYRLTRLGTALSPIHRALANWSRNYLTPNTIADAERIEDAVSRLRLRHSTAVIAALAAGPQRFLRIAEAVGLDDSSARQRLLRLQADGLVTRTGPRHGDPYALTAAGQALGPVHAAIERWMDPAGTTRNAAASVATATRTPRAAPPGPDGICAAVALRRSPAAPSGLFSHAPQPQPRVPATITAQSSPARRR